MSVETMDRGYTNLSQSKLSERLDRRRLRILVSAYAFSPVSGSEPGVGWNVCSRLAAYHDVTVLARSWNENLWPEDERHREEAERVMRAIGPIPGLVIHFVDTPPLGRLLQPHPLVDLRSPFYFQGYAAWQRAAYRKAVRLHRERPFDATHQLTIASFREPGYLWKLGVPFIWGPIGGGENIPRSYFADFRGHDRIYYTCKNIANKIQLRSKMRSRMAAQRARLVLVNNAELCATITRWGHAPKLMLEVGAPNWSGRPRCYDNVRTLQLCWIGLHIGRKGLPIALRALAELKARGLEQKVHLTILGAGPETQTWQALSRQLQLQGMTTWIGQIPFQRVREELGKQDAFVTSSLQESTSNVLMEALASGLPVVCHDVGGMSFAIDQSCGLKIPLRSRQNSIREFANAIDQLATCPGLLNRLSEGALRRARALSWDELVKKIASAYDTNPSAEGSG